MIDQHIIECFRQRGGSDYGGEAVTQLEHALQCAHFADSTGAADSLVVAALLHDIGHLLHDLPNDSPDQGIDDHHENVGYHYVRRHFSPAVSEPVRLHVAAKRYLCAVDKNYLEALSQPSVVSLALQGGVMSGEEIAEFRKLTHWEDAVELRRWDDRAKVPELRVPELDYYLPRIRKQLEAKDSDR